MMMKNQLRLQHSLRFNLRFRLNLFNSRLRFNRHSHKCRHNLFSRHRLNLFSSKIRCKHNRLNQLLITQRRMQQLLSQTSKIRF